ncbi:MAG: hypothetical protein Q9195_007775 [Heterodermia aff. obscurata]
MKPEVEYHQDPGTGEADIVESLKGLNVGKDEAVVKKAGISSTTSAIETRDGETSSKEEGSSSEGGEGKLMNKDVAQGSAAKGQKDHTPSWIKNIPPPEPWMSPSQITHMFTSARNEAARLLSSAEILEANVTLSDIIPSDPLVRQQFGYSKVNSVEEETCLQGLYKALLDLLPHSPSSSELQDWVQQDKLAEGIEGYYTRFGAQSGYFNWFKRNKHVFSQRYERVGGPWAPDEEWFESDQNKLHELTKSDTEPEDEVESNDGD